MLSAKRVSFQDTPEFFPGPDATQDGRRLGLPLPLIDPLCCPAVLER